MQDGLLPLFPLQVVLFPRTPLPLHIFEERYREMFRELLTQKAEFGVVQAAENGVVSTGCSASVERVLQHHDDGRLDLIAIGRRRFEIVMLNEERSFLRGAVQFFDDEDSSLPSQELRRRAVEGYKALRRTVDEEEVPEPQWGDPQLSFQLAQAVSDLDFRQTLLATKSEAERIRQIAEFLPEYVFRQKLKAHVREVAPHNGFAAWNRPL